MKMLRIPTAITALLFSASLGGCGSEKVSSATVRLKNDFDNPEMAAHPPWTLCKTSYLGVEFGHLGIGETSEAKAVTPGLDYVLMVASWADPDCAPEHCLPIATKNEEEVVDGQSRTISINMPNHQGACPPEGVAPIPEPQYERILKLWPEFEFRPYAERTENRKCKTE